MNAFSHSLPARNDRQDKYLVISNEVRDLSQTELLRRKIELLLPDAYCLLPSYNFLINPLFSNSATKLMSTNSSGLRPRISGRRAAAIS